MVDEGVSEAELSKAKTRLEVELYRGLQTLQQRAYNLGFWQSVAGHYEEMFKRPETLRNVSIEDIKRVANQLLDLTRHFSVYGIPSVSSST